MNPELDLAKLAAHFAQQNAERFIGAAASGVKDLTTQVKARLNRTYRTYIERILERYGKGKSFFVRSEPIPLYSFFVPLDIRTEVRHLSRPTAADLGEVSPFSIIAGSGGSGKSMLMRHLLISSITENVKTPIFLELRQLNGTTDTLLVALLKVLHTFGLDVDERFLEEALKSGQLLLLLDGFDEVEQSARRRIAAEIQQLERYPRTWLVLSSRPDAALHGWEPFTHYRILPLTIQSATELVSRVPYEEDIKKRFIIDMQRALFDQHKSFLSNPLLLSIMLLTYGDVAHIPQKLSTFYSQAYEALFHRHDALKSGFQREKKTGLDIQDYARAFAAFSLFSYDQRQFSFTSTRALQWIGMARETAMLTYDDKDFLEDAIQAVCLLLEEGLEITFAHRSFQEYFAARYIQSSPSEVKAKLIQRYSTSVQMDQTMALLWEIDTYFVEKHYILPQLADLRYAIDVVDSVGIRHLHKYLRLIYDSFRLDEDLTVRATVKNERLHAATKFISERYRPIRGLTDEESLRSDKLLAEAFEADFEDLNQISTDRLRLKGAFIRAAAEVGGAWSLQFLKSLMDIEGEIHAKHQGNRESLEQLLGLDLGGNKKLR
jgi:predicted NACHT family NTPase